MRAPTAACRAVVFVVAAVAIAACTRPEAAAPLPATMADGAYALPAGYRDWPVFLRGVQRPDNGQVRDIYLNRVAAGATAGQPFPDGSVLVMDLFAAQKGADGSLVKGPDGALVRGDLIKRFVMAKGPGWGAGVMPAALRTGDWVYSAWLPDGQPAPDPVAGCRGCHLPLAAQDYVPRASEYFASRR